MKHKLLYAIKCGEEYVALDVVENVLPTDAMHSAMLYTEFSDAIILSANLRQDELLHTYGFEQLSPIRVVELEVRENEL